MMKKSISIVVCILCTLLLNAHPGHYEKVSLRTWHLGESNREIDASFLMFKDGNVYLEDKNEHVIHYPIEEFSRNDQDFVLKKYEKISRLNAGSSAEEATDNNSFVYTIILLSLALGSAMLIIFLLYRRNQKSKGLLVIVTVFSTLILMGFTKKMFKTSDPFFLKSAFDPFSPKVNTRWDAKYFYVESTGIPDHEMMTGITGWQQQFPIPQCYIGSNAWSIPLNPVKATTPVPVNQQHFLRGAIAVAANGIAIFNPYTNTGVDAYLDGQLDKFGGHCGRADDYHYHIAPLFLDDKTPDILPIAFALDGFAVYGNLEPDGSSMKTLDANHGHDGANGIYHYHGTTGAPYMIGNMVGVVTEDSTLQIIPQAQAKPIRPAGTPLKGAVITGCRPNSTGNGYSLTYTLSGKTDSVVYNWTGTGLYTFDFYSSGIKTTSTYNGTAPCSVPTGINSLPESKDQVTLYPNPSKSSLNIELAGNISEDEIQSIAIYDLNGQQMRVIDHYEKRMSTDNLREGIYLLEIRFRNSRVVKKIMIEKVAP